MKSTFNICFYAKKDKQKGNGAYPLFARITVDGVASRFNTKLDVLPSIWDGKMGKATGRTSEASRINRMLDDINASLNTIYHEMQRRDNYVTAEKVKNEFLGHSESHETILSLFQKHNDDVKQLVGISKTIATYRKYEVTRRHLAGFIRSKYNVSDISIKEISPMFITDFELYLRTVCKCGYNTTAKFMQFFKRIIIIARNNGILVNDPFANYKIRLEKVDRGYLTEDEIIADKQKAYEQAMLNRKQQDKIQSLQDFGFTGDDETEEPQAEIDLMPEEDAKPQRGGGASYSANAYRDINRQLSTFYETPAVDEEKEDLKRQVAELTDRLQQQQNATPTADDQMALLEKSYELAAKYMNGQDGERGQITQIPTAGQNGGGIGTPAIPVQAIRETTVSGLQQPMSDADFIRAYSQPRNYGFNTAVGTGYAMGRNTIAACIHQDQTLTDGQAVKLRLLEPMQAGNIVVPKNTLVAGTAKVQGERLDILVSSIEYAGNIIPVELAVFDTDGQKGLSVPSSMEQEAFNEAMANIGSGLGTSISFARSAGQQVAMDVTRGLLQGTSGYLAKKFRTVKVKLKAGYKVMLYAKQQ